MNKKKKTYSDKTKRHTTQYPGVFERKAERVIDQADICYDIAYKVDGKKIWEKVGWRSQGYSVKLAAQIRAERIRALQHGQELPQQKKKAPYFREVMEKYLEWAKTNKSRGGRDEESLYRNHITKKFGNVRLNEISAFDLERTKADLLKTGYSPKSVNLCLALIRQVYNKAFAWGLYRGENPVKGVKMPHVQNQRERFLSYDEAAALLNTLKIKSILVHDMSLLSLHSGLRFGEICNLKGQDLDFVNGFIHISDPKNKSARKAFMTKDLKEMLRERMPDNPAELVFKDRLHGGKIEGVSQTFNRVISELKLNEGIIDPRQKITFHSIRHTFASWLAIQGTPILTISHLLGHKSLAMTQRYAHLSPDIKKKAVLSLENGFKNAIKKMMMS